MDLVAWAADESARRLERVGTRRSHCSAVARRAAAIAPAVAPADQSLLVAAAYLHDVGHAAELTTTGFHPLDGALWLRERGLERLASLVAHHTAAIFEARERGLDEALRVFANENSAVSDALAYCDLTTGPAGEPVSVAQRLAEIEARYGEESVVVRALEQASVSLSGMIERTEQRVRCGRRSRDVSPAKTSSKRPAVR
jgi:putative nucleotidyltransferase with HDIG domain